MPADEATVTVSIPETPDVVIAETAAPLVVVVEDDSEDSAAPIISEVIDLAVSDAVKDARITELENQNAELVEQARLTSETAQLALDLSIDALNEVADLKDPQVDAEDDVQPNREHPFYRKFGSKE